MIVVIPCGGKKRLVSCVAGRMYIGPYHRACLTYALTLVPPERVYILSAKYGLLALDERIAPYNLKMGQRGCVTARTVADQAAARGLRAEERVIALGGRAYTDVARAVWSHAETPLDGVGGMGYQMQWLKQHTSHHTSARATP